MTPTDLVDSQDWAALTTEIDALGCAQTQRILDADQCAEVAEMYSDDARFRSTIDMARYRYGQGQYRYFDNPIPQPIADLRAAFYRHLLPIARDWAQRLGDPAPWPDTLDEWLAMCHERGQTRPTPILLRYGVGDWNALHRDLYGDLVFPLQVVLGLDRPGSDHSGGEFMLVEQRPRAQSRGTVTVLQQGHGLIFTTRDRPVRSTRGWTRSPVRHGVSPVRTGHRRTLGLVLHDAE